jgi:rhomboid protease GluP
LLFFSPSNQSLLVLGATGTIPIDHYHRWWTLISAGYLHGGILHVFFNMMALKQVGPLVIQEFGLFRMVILYVLTGITGYGISYLAGIPFTIGASASICGLIGALLYYGWHRGGVYGHMLFRQISGWVIALFCFGFIVPGINNWGHGGGLLGGVMLASLLGYRENRKDHPVERVFAAICILLTVSILSWAVVSGLGYRMAHGR